MRLHRIIEKLNKLLTFIDFEAYVEWKDNIPMFKVTDLQCANYGGIEEQEFSSPCSLIGRLSTYFEDIFLDGDICCNQSGVYFETYDEALGQCLKVGYFEEARGIGLLMSYQR